MNKLFKLLGKLFKKIWYFRRDLKMKAINKELAHAVLDQNKGRKEFLHEFRFYLRKYLRKDASGKYIPLKGKNKAEIYEHVMHKYGEDLKRLNIKFSEDLKISL